MPKNCNLKMNNDICNGSIEKNGSGISLLMWLCHVKDHGVTQITSCDIVHELEAADHY